MEIFPFLDMQTHDASSWIFLLQCLWRWGRSIQLIALSGLLATGKKKGAATFQVLFPQSAEPMWGDRGRLEETEKRGHHGPDPQHAPHSSWGVRRAYRYTWCVPGSCCSLCKEEARDWNVTFWVTMHTWLCPWAMQLYIFCVQGSCWLCDLNKFQSFCSCNFD